MLDDGIHYHTSSCMFVEILAVFAFAIRPLRTLRARAQLYSSLPSLCHKRTSIFLLFALVTDDVAPPAPSTRLRLSLCVVVVVVVVFVVDVDRIVIDALQIYLKYKL